MPTICRFSNAITRVGRECAGNLCKNDVMKREPWAVQVDNLATRARIHGEEPDNLIVQANR